jgi:predicted Zn-dependent protease
MELGPFVTPSARRSYFGFMMQIRTLVAEATSQTSEFPTMRKFSLERTAALVVLVLAIPAVLLASHSWGGYHWARTSNPLSLKVGNNMDSTWSPYLNTALSDWNQSTVLNLAPVAGTSNRRCAMVSGTVQVCNGKYGNNGWLGLASIYIKGGVHITQGSAKMNDTYFLTSKYNNPNERLHVVCQEIGHTWGLDHQSEDGTSLNTCMDYFSNTGANAGSTLSTHPNKHDYDELITIYTHLDSFNTAAAITAGSTFANEVTNDPNSWGQLVSQSKNGRSSTYERHHSDGSKTVTHVYWTQERAAYCPGCDHRFDE